MKDLDTIIDYISKNKVDNGKNPPYADFYKGYQDIFFNSKHLINLYRNYEEFIEVAKKGDITKDTIIRVVKKNNQDVDENDIDISSLKTVNIISEYLKAVCKTNDSRQLDYELTSFLNEIGKTDKISAIEKTKKFVLNTDLNYLSLSDMPDLTLDYPFEKSVDKIEDMMIMFRHPNKRYSRLSIMISKMDGDLTLGEKKYTDIFGISVLIKERNVACYYYIKDNDKFIYVPRISSVLLDECQHNCGNCPKIECKEAKSQICKVSRNKIEKGHCLLKAVNPYILLSLFAYCTEMYEGRKTITRKNSPNKRKYDNGMKISVVTTEFNNITEDDIKAEEKISNTEYKLISLEKVYRYEKKAWQGGHHKSPVEHTRSSHPRRIYNKDGTLKRITQVTSTIVNKGNRGNNAEKLYTATLPQDKKNHN